MKIEHRGIRITDLPMFDSVEVGMDPDDEVVVVLVSPQTNVAVGIEGAIAIRDALSVLVDHARTMTGATSPTREPRTWRKGDPEPPGVTKVLDRDDDPWFRRADGKWYLGRRGATPFTWTELLTDLAPLTEVIS